MSAKRPALSSRPPARTNSWARLTRSVRQGGPGVTRPLGVLALALGLVAAMPGSAGASSGWSVQPTPNPLAQGSLVAVSCPSASACIAVGNDLNSSSGVKVTLAEVWNGTTWAIETTPNPSGATNSYLLGASCTSSTACTAVGYYYNSSSVPLTLAEVWNGTSWAIETTPNPSGATSSALEGRVVHFRNRMHRGRDYHNSSGVVVTLAEVWNGSSWAIQTTPNPTGARSSFLRGMSCTSAAACTAVGDYVNNSGNGVTLAERWNGISWAVETTPNASGATSSALNGVSCTSATACTAAGNYHNSARVYVTLAERWNGTSWSIQTTPNPTGAKSSALNGITCISATACGAVGNYTNSSGVEETLAERWNGTSWVVETTPNPSGAENSVLGGVSCTSATACTAVGYYLNNSGVALTLAEGWNGTSWAIQTTPNPTPPGLKELNAVSCTSTTACTAVGYYYNSSGVPLTLAEVWNGTFWAIETTPNPNPSGAESSVLGGVSCTSATACTAVGYYLNNSGVQLTLAERWNGTSWAVETTPNPSGAVNSVLGGVSCTSTTACTAVGYSSNSYGGDGLTLAERWNGTTWTVETTPNPSGSGYSSLGGVSCTLTTACTAVGYYYNNNSGVLLTLAEALERNLLDDPDDTQPERPRGRTRRAASRAPRRPRAPPWATPVGPARVPGRPSPSDGTGPPGPSRRRPTPAVAG